MNPQAIIDQYVRSAPGVNNFTKEFGRFGDLWKSTFSPISRAAALQDSVDYINPLRKEAQRGVRGGLAKRGMFRSSLLKRDLGKTRDDYDEQRDLRTESGSDTRKSELRGAYDSLFRASEKDPTGATKTFRELLNSYKG